MNFTIQSGLVDSIFGKSQAPIQMYLESRGEAYEQKSIVKELFNVGKSTHYAEKFTGMTAMSGFQPVGENGEYPNDDAQEGYSKTFEHEVWKDKFAISREIIDDGNLIDLKKKPEGFIKGYYRTREMFGAALLGNAIKGNTSMSFRGKSFSTAGADGLCLFSTAHTAKVKGATQSNCFANEFSADALGAVESQMQLFRGDNEEILDVSPTTIVIPNIASLKKLAFQAVGSNEDPETANNGINYHCGRWQIITWSYLNQFITADTSPWLLLDKEYSDLCGTLVWLDRVALEVESKKASNDANEWSGYARWSAGFHDWRGIAVGGVAGATTLS